MKATIPVITLLFLVLVNQAKAQDVAEMTPDELEDLYDMLNNITLKDRGRPNVRVEASEIKYFLITKDKNNGTEIKSDNINIINKNKSLVVLIHGWTQDANTSWYKLMINAYFNKSNDQSILLVDYSKYAKQNYVFAAYDAQFVGKYVGEFIAKLIENKIPRKKILVIGHSLGGQVAGFSGQTVYKNLGEKIHKMVALDPAGPLFELKSTDLRLDQSDADFLEVIHTNGGVLGMFQSCGDIDFFPNGGSYQVGCVRQVIRDISEITNAVFCPHHTSWQYFAKSINDPKAYLGEECSSWISYPFACDDTEYMGNLDTKKTGDYYLRVVRIPYKEY